MVPAVAKKASTLPASPPEEKMAQINIRMPDELLQRVDAWVAEMNAARSWPKLTRSDVIRSLLDWAEKGRPEWVGK